MAESDLIQTGIAGLDDIFLGGVRRGNVILVDGAAGTGKTMLGTEFVYRGINQFNEPGIIVTFEVSPQKLVRDAAGFGWDLEELQRQDKLKIIFSSPQVLRQELRSPDSLLLTTAAQMGAVRIFVDGISLLRTVSNGDNNAKAGEVACYRELLQQLIEGLQRENLTAVFSHEVTVGEQQAYPLEVTEYLADTVIVLRREQKRRGILRSLEITKSRGQDYDTGRHTLQINSGQGLEVYRRIQSPPRDPLSWDQPTSSDRQTLLGQGPLDELMGGGVLEGSVTMVVGVSGVGKSVLGLQLLTEGFRQHGQRGLLVTLDEHPRQVVRNGDSLGIDLKKQLEDGTLHILYDCPQELALDVHYRSITRAVEEKQIGRLVIDGVTTYSGALQDSQLFRDFVHALVNYCKTRRLTVFLNCENPELFGVNQYMPDFPVSSLVDNMILLNFVELGSKVHRALTVAKTRGSANQFVTREFVIGPGGISFVPVDETKALPVLPFQSYYGLLSRAPTRLSPNVLPGGGTPVAAAGAT